VAPVFIQAAEEKNQRDAYEKKTHVQIEARHALRMSRLRWRSGQAAPGTFDRPAKELFAFIDPRRCTPARIPSRFQPDITAAPRWPATPTRPGSTDTLVAARSDDAALRTVQVPTSAWIAGNFDELLATVPIDPQSVGARRDRGGGEAKEGRGGGARRPFGLVMLELMIVMVGSAPMLSAVTEDKNQRIFEMLLGLATPMELMAARVMAALGRSLSSSAF
jgi:hypothetical protein